MPSDSCLHRAIQSYFQIFEVDFSSFCHKCHELFPWLVLNRLRKICLPLQCVRLDVCSAAFFS